jgi:hypothetical protein
MGTKSRGYEAVVPDAPPRTPYDNGDNGFRRGEVPQLSPQSDTIAAVCRASPWTRLILEFCFARGRATGGRG